MTDPDTPPAVPPPSAQDLARAPVADHQLVTEWDILDCDDEEMTLAYIRRTCAAEAEVERLLQLNDTLTRLLHQNQAAVVRLRAAVQDLAAENARLRELT